jgi:hypothetical protein
MWAYAINKGTYTYGTNYDETYVSKDLTGKRSDYHYGRCSV